MIRQYLSNTNENTTVHILQNFLQVNKALDLFSGVLNRLRSVQIVFGSCFDVGDLQTRFRHVFYWDKINPSIYIYIYIYIYN